MFAIRVKAIGFLTILCAAAIAMALAILPSRVCFADGKNYTFYCGTSSADCREVKSVFNAELERLLLPNVCGESAEYDSFDLESYLIKVNGAIVFTEELSDSVNYYCTADLPYSVNINGRTINLHVCVKSDRVKVASPIIFGGY